MIDTMASSYEYPEEVINYYYANEQQLNQIQNMVLEDQVIDSVLAGASVVEKTMGYEEAIKPATKNSLADESEASADEGLEAPAS